MEELRHQGGLGWLLWGGFWDEFQGFPFSWVRPRPVPRISSEVMVVVMMIVMVTDHQRRERRGPAVPVSIYM